ncbi:MAG: Zn-dependent hydrolase [Gemmatimonadetes bacterium RIFCSPLOWO2_12_FULL_68_9]|nr:MAG: Zn-dependent hydrolase [Gemmatimonadetes bacterium RIFCSPLOWO2_12_FULL_68_9]
MKIASLVVAWMLIGAAICAEPRVNGERLNAHLEALAAFGKTARGGVARLAYSEEDRQARDYIASLMKGAGLQVSIDAAGNIVGRRNGRDPHLPPLVLGSHIDSVPDGGKYDGNVGSLGAIEVAQTLSEQGLTLRHPLEVIIFQNEEGGLIGSTALLGELTEILLDQRSRSGKTIREGVVFLGGDPAALEKVKRQRGSIASYLELHIEQGGILDAEKLDIGVVEGIVGIKWWEVTIDGFANHAGTTPMNQRQDALLAAARFIESVNRIVRSVPGRHVGTVGRIQALPGAPNVIPGRVVASLELRDLEETKIDMLFQKIEAEARAIAKESGTTFGFAPLHVNAPAPTDPRVREAIEKNVRALGLTSKVMPSGAGHDAQNMSRLGPAGMIFVPSARGISHSPLEFSRPSDITNGANVLLRTVIALDRGLSR